MKALSVFFILFLSSVLATTQVLWNQPVREASEASGEKRNFERMVSLGVAAPRTFSAPDISGFNFDSFAADDFFVDSFSQINQIQIHTSVDQLDSFTIESVFIGIYNDTGGLPNYDPYSPTDPAPAWSQSFPWASNDPEATFPLPWLQNPLRRGIIQVSVDVSLMTGAYWLVMHYEISQSSISIPPVTWLPGKTQGYDSGSPARLFVPGDNPSAAAANAFGWFWNSLRREGLGDLAFSIYGTNAQFILQTNALDNLYFYRCAGENHITVNLTVNYFDTSSWNQSLLVQVDLPVGSPLDVVWNGNDTLNITETETSFRLRYFTQGNDYSFSLNLTGEDGITYWIQDFIVRAVNDPLNPPTWVQRDKYGLIGGLFQWVPQSISENFDFEIDEDGGDFSNPELSVVLPGWDTSYRPVLADYDPTGNVSVFGARPQAFYIARIRSVNPDCNQTSEWVTLRFESDECEMTSVVFTNGTYNFEKGQWVTSSWTLTDDGTMTDFRVRVRGFHQRWSDVGLGVATPVDHDNSLVAVPLFAEACDMNWDSSPPSTDTAQEFEIFFAIGGIDDSMCPRPPQSADPTNTTWIEPWGANVFLDYVSGQDKRGTWALEWIDYGVGFPTNGKITDYDTLLCSIPVPPQEHIIYKGESKVRRGTVAVYGP